MREGKRGRGCRAYSMRDIGAEVYYGKEERRVRARFESEEKEGG